MAGRLSREEERRTAAEAEVGRQKACIRGLRVDAAELEDALHRTKTQVSEQTHARLGVVASAWCVSRCTSCVEGYIPGHIPSVDSSGSCIRTLIAIEPVETSSA